MSRQEKIPTYELPKEGKNMKVKVKRIEIKTSEELFTNKKTGEYRGLSDKDTKNFVIIVEIDGQESRIGQLSFPRGDEPHPRSNLSHFMKKYNGRSPFVGQEVEARYDTVKGFWRLVTD